MAKALKPIDIAEQCYNVNLQQWSHLPIVETMENETLSCDAKGKAAKPWQVQKSCHKKVAKRNMIGSPLLCEQRYVSLWEKAKSQNGLYARGA